MSARGASAAVDWSKIYTGLGLNKETITELQSFRARHTSAVNRNAAIKASIPALDLSAYKAILKDGSAVAAAERALAEFKPVDYDVSKWDGVVAAFEGKAVAAAKETVDKIKAEETSLKSTLSNIQEARPFEDLTVAEVSHARPEITKAVETMLKKGKWTVPGYREKFGEFSLM
ncbi:ATP synthase d subunit [Cryptotrichosporon argae]